MSLNIYYFTNLSTGDKVGDLQSIDLVKPKNYVKSIKDIDYKKIYTGRIIVGAEFNCVFNNAKIELLGYNFNLDKINDFCTNTYTKNAEYMDLKKEFQVKEPVNRRKKWEEMYSCFLRKEQDAHDELAILL